MLDICDLAEWWLNNLCKILPKCLVVSSLHSYSLLNYTVCKFRPLITRYLGTECLLNSKLSDTLAYFSSARFFSNPLSVSEKLQKKNSFSMVVPALAFISVNHMFDKVAFLLSNYQV